MNTTLITWGRCEKQSMLFSNLHSFHFAKKLQNATALPAHVYRKISNRNSINSDTNIPYVSIPLKTPQKPVRMKRAGQTETPGNLVKSPFEELREPVVIEGRATRKPLEQAPPVIDNVVETKPKKAPLSKKNADFQGKYARPKAPQVNTKPSPIPQRSHITRRNVWKPGHGTIEKVDKLTGEIVHLAEEYIDNEKIKAISSI